MQRHPLQLRPGLQLAALSLALVACSPRPAAEGTTAAAADSIKSTPPSVTSSPPLAGTHWRLVALGDKPVTVANAQREPHMTLGSDSRVTGSGGCNRMFGTYALNGDALTFSGVGSTKMACQDGMDIETAFLPALSRVAKWRITGQHLELTDAGGALVARFEGR